MISRPSLRMRVATAFAGDDRGASRPRVFLHVRVTSTLEDQVVEGVAARLDALQRLPADARTAAIEDLTGVAFAQVLDRDGTVVVSSPEVRDALLSPGRLPAPGVTKLLEVQLFLTTEGESAEPVVDACRRRS